VSPFTIAAKPSIVPDIMMPPDTQDGGRCLWGGRPGRVFAVAVVAFFERPVVLRHAEPAVYEQISEFFHLEPSNSG
jgi:hypothetical protein